MLGYRQRDQKNILDIFKMFLETQDLHHFSEALEKHRLDHSSFCVQYKFQLESGKSNGFQIRGGFYYRKDGNAFQFIGTLNALRQQQWSTPDRRYQKELAQNILMSMGDAVITTTMKGYITYLNPEAESLTGYLNEEAQGLEIEEIFDLVHGFSGQTIALTPSEHDRAWDENFYGRGCGPDFPG